MMMTTRIPTKTKKTVTANRLHAAPLLLGLAVALLALTPVRLAARPSSQTNQEQSAEKPKKDYALIFGTVWDKNDRPAYGVKIKIRRADKKKAQWELMSDHMGEFAQRVPVGTADYVVWADMKRPKDAKPVESKVHIENNERVDIALHLTE
jgi:hypothetical protein